jgi:hypothetical protein
VDSVRSGGLVVLDDFTPGYRSPDPVRDFWLRDGALLGVELMVASDHAVVVAVRK